MLSFYEKGTGTRPFEFRYVHIGKTRKAVVQHQVDFRDLKMFSP